MIEKEIKAISKPLTKEQIQLKKFRTLESKTLTQLLLHRFLNHYGYDKGEVTAKAIIENILKLIFKFLCSVKRKQALLRSNLSGLAGPRKISGRPFVDPPDHISIFLVVPQKTYGIIAAVSPLAI